MKDVNKGSGPLATLLKQEIVRLKANLNKNKYTQGIRSALNYVHFFRTIGNNTFLQIILDFISGLFNTSILFKFFCKSW